MVNCQIVFEWIQSQAHGTPGEKAQTRGVPAGMEEQFLQEGTDRARCQIFLLHSSYFQPITVCC